jgi:hypothetical protein
MNIYEYSREVFTNLTGDNAQFNGWAYDINNPMHVDAEMSPISLFNDIVNSELGLLAENITISCNDNICNVLMEGEPLTEEQKTMLDNIVQTHKNYRVQQ